MKKYAIVNGPNLNRLGKRQPEIYGSETLADLEAYLKKEGESLGVELIFFQSNHEGELIEKYAELADNKIDGVVFNHGGLTHTSVALRDALAGTDLPAVEVHISNIYEREEFRHLSFTAPIAKGIISGLGFYGYVCALRYLAGGLKEIKGFRDND